MLVVFLLFLVHHVLAKGNIDSDDTSKPPLRFLKKVNNCNSAGFFMSPEEIQKKFGFGLCYLCFCFDKKQAICFLRKNMKCEKKNYINFGSSDKEIYNQIIASKNGICKPFQDIHSIGCPPHDWCEGCKICDCVSDKKWNCQHVKYCDINAKKDQLRLTIANLKEEIKAKQNIKDVSNLDKNRKHSKFTPIIYKKELRNLLNIKPRNNKAFPKNHTILLAQNIVRRVIQKLKRIESDGTYSEMLPKLINVIRNCTQAPKSDKINDTKSKNSKSTSATISKEKSSTHMVIRGATKQMRQRETFRRKKRQAEINTAVLTLKKTGPLEATDNKTNKDINIINMLNETKIPWYKAILTESINKSLTQNNTIGKKNTFLVNASVLNSNKPKEVPKFLGKLSTIDQSTNNMTENVQSEKKPISKNNNKHEYANSIKHLKEKNKMLENKEILESNMQKNKTNLSYNFKIYDQNLKGKENVDSTVKYNAKTKTNIQTAIRQNMNLTGNQDTNNTVDPKKRENLKSNQNAHFITELNNYSTENFKENNKAENIKKDISRQKKLNINSEEQKQKGIFEINELNLKGIENNESTVEEKTRSQINEKHGETATKNILGHHTFLNTQDELSSKEIVDNVLVKNLFSSNTTHHGAEQVIQSSKFFNPIIRITHSSEKLNENKSDLNMDKVRKGALQIKEDYGLKNSSQIPTTQSDYSSTSDTLLKSKDVNTTKHGTRSATNLDLDLLNKYSVYVIENTTSQNAADVRNSTMVGYYKYSLAESNEGDKSPKNLSKTGNGNEMNDSLIIAINNVVTTAKSTVVRNVDRLKMYRTKIIGTPKKFTVKRILKMAIPYSRNADRISFDRSTTPYETKRRENLKDVIDKLLNIFKSKENPKSVAHNEKKKNNVMSYFSKIIKKIFYKINKDHKKNLKTGFKVINEVNVLDNICEILGNCNFNPDSYVVVHNKIQDLDKDFRRIMESINIIKGLLDLIDFSVDLRNNTLTRTGVKHGHNLNADLLKLRLILKYNSTSENDKYIHLTETELRQINYTKSNVKTLTQSIKSFVNNLKDIISILQNQNTQISRKVRTVSNETLENENMKIQHYLKNAQRLLYTYGHMQSSLMQSVYEIMKKINKNLQNRNNKNDLKKIKNSKRRKRYAIDGDETLEYMLVLIEYLLKKKVIAAQANDGIDAIIEAIRNAPEIKPFQKLMDREKSVKISNLRYDKGADNSNRRYISSTTSYYGKNGRKSLKNIFEDIYDEDNTVISKPIQEYKSFFIDYPISQHASNKKSNLGKVEIESSEEDPIGISIPIENKKASFVKENITKSQASNEKSGLSQVEVESSQINNDKENKTFNSKLFSSIIDQEMSVGLEDSLENSGTFSKEKEQNKIEDVYKAYLDKNDTFIKYLPYKDLSNDEKTISNESNEYTKLNEVASEKTKFDYLEETYEQKNKNLNYRTFTTRTKTIKPTKDKLVEKYKYKEINDYDYKPKITSKEILAVKTKNFLNSLDYDVTDKMDLENNDY